MPDNFYRSKSELEKKDNYQALGTAFYKGRKIDKGIIFNKHNANAYNLKDFFLFNAIFGYFKDKIA